LTPDFFASLEKPVNFYFLRHGQSEGNAEKILQGRGDYVLSELGRSQSIRRGRSLKTLIASREDVLLFSSPLARAKETALLIAGETGLGEPAILEDLTEMELGIWTGKPWEQAKTETSLWQSFKLRSWDAIPRAESSADLYNRAMRVWALLRDTALEKDAGTVISVTHGGLIQWLLKCTLQCRSWFPLFPISNCGLFSLCAEPLKGPLKGQNSAFICWDKINSTLSDESEESRGFPS